MATILNNNQVERIKKIREKINGIRPEGWMCEGADDRCNQFFNNDTGAFFIATYSGQIVNSEGEIPLSMKMVAKLEGEISLICEE